MVGGLISYPFAYRGIIGASNNYNDFKNSGLYGIGDDKSEAVNSPGVRYGVMAVFSAGGQTGQKIFDSIRNYEITRIGRDNGTWSAWKIAQIS